MLPSTSNASNVPTDVTFGCPSTVNVWLPTKFAAVIVPLELILPEAVIWDNVWILPLDVI